MAHKRRTKYFSRKFTARKALFRGLIVSLVEHGRIKTTVDKAKEIRRHVEKAITLGKKGDLATRRLLTSRIANEDTVDTILTDVSKRMMDRPGGYTRIIKIGRRPGDTAEMAFIEFVDYDWEAKGAAKKGADKKEAAAEEKAKTKARKKASKLVVAKKKAAKKAQSSDRAISRASRA